MHKYVEEYVLGKRYADMRQIGQLSNNMGQKVIDKGLAQVDGYYGSEDTLYYPDLYAGSTDLVGLHDGKESIIDFKQSKRPKFEDWIEDYIMQMAGYIMAHDHVHGGNLQQGVIRFFTPDLYRQENKLNEQKLGYWKQQLLKGEVK